MSLFLRVPFCHSAVGGRGSWHGRLAVVWHPRRARARRRGPGEGALEELPLVLREPLRENGTRRPHAESEAVRFEERPGDVEDDKDLNIFDILLQ